MNREIISPGQFFLGVLGLVAWITAGLFGAIPTTVDTVVAVGDRGTANSKAPSPSGAGAACGFAVAGGLCFLAAARVVVSPAPGRGRTDLAAVLDQLRFRGVLTDAEYRGLRDKLGLAGTELPAGPPLG